MLVQLVYDRWMRLKRWLYGSSLKAYHLNLKQIMVEGDFSLCNLVSDLVLVWLQTELFLPIQNFGIALRSFVLEKYKKKIKKINVYKCRKY